LVFEASFQTLALLSAPSADPVAVKRIEEDLKAGKKMTLLEVEYPFRRGNAPGRIVQRT
jgi:hypothetical protein